MTKLFANSGDPDQKPHSAASDLGLQCLPITLLGDFRLNWVTVSITTAVDNIHFFLFFYLFFLLIIIFFFLRK